MNERILSAERSVLVLVDLQARLVPVIDGVEEMLANVRRLAEAARLLDVSIVGTEHMPAGLGGTVAEFADYSRPMIEKSTFDACMEPRFAAVFIGAGRRAVVAGCEAHVCVLQTVLGLLDQGVSVAVVADALGARRPESKRVAIDRMARHGAEIVTTEMVVFEWLRDARRPEFRAALALVKSRSGPRRDHHDLDEEARGGEPGLDGGPGGRAARGDPGIPDGVHLGEGGHVGEPDGGG